MSKLNKTDQVFQKFSELRKSGTLSGRDFMRLLQSVGFEVNLTRKKGGAGHCSIMHKALPPEYGTAITLTHGLKGDVGRFYITHICKIIDQHENIIRDYLK